MDVSDLAASHGQGWLQVGELLLAFGLSAAVGLERHLRGKSAGLRTQTIVGVSSALFMLVSKYGFGDVLAEGYVVLDPSRVAAQIVSGIGFLGAGLILIRGDSIQGLTTAASVWETAAIGTAAGAGLPLLALIVTVLHFVSVFGFTWLVHRFPRRGAPDVRLRIGYRDGQGSLRQLLGLSTDGGWSVTQLRTSEHRVDGEPRVTAILDLTHPVAGAPDPAADDLVARLAAVAGVTDIRREDRDDLE
ncbi:MgtC/SapB family protein [Spongisporangium articulatum]|uniref:MgtC/SapB family protein n=1 Tax=Spongisporangium articulatum TaxID=3362603 RepID=A0ABW8ALK0_9ACTN